MAARQPGAMGAHSQGINFMGFLLPARLMQVTSNRHGLRFKIQSRKPEQGWRACSTRRSRNKKHRQALVNSSKTQP